MVRCIVVRATAIAMMHSQKARNVVDASPRCEKPCMDVVLENWVVAFFIVFSPI